MMSFGGWGLELLTTTVRVRVKLASKMALYKYFTRERLTYPTKVSSLSDKQVEQTNAEVKRALEEDTSGHGKYEYTPEERAQIGKFAAEHGPAKAVRHFSKLLSRKVPETTARRLKSEYLLKLKDECRGESTVPEVKSLHTKPQGRPLLLGKQLDKSVQEYIDPMRKVGGVVNTAIVMAAAWGVIASRHPGLLREHGGHIEITKAWAKSLLMRMGYVKRKCSNAGKISVSHFEEVKEEFLVDIKAEVVMNEIPHELIFN